MTNLVKIWLIFILIGAIMVIVSQTDAFQSKNSSDDENALLTVGLILGSIGVIGALFSYNQKAGNTENNLNNRQIPTNDNVTGTKKFCSECGAQISTTAIFCSNCGNKVS